MNCFQLHSSVLLIGTGECADGTRKTCSTLEDHVSLFCMALLRESERLDASLSQTAESVLSKFSRNSCAHRRPQVVDGIEPFETDLLPRPAAGRLSANRLAHPSNAADGTLIDSRPASAAKHPGHDRSLAHDGGEFSVTTATGQAVRHEPRKACHEERDACQRPPTGGKPHRHP